jgi:hypothetical protein
MPAVTHIQALFFHYNNGMDFKINSRVPQEISEDISKNSDSSTVQQQPATQDAIESVDFPNFVSGLVEGTFQGIVDSSIQQTDEYGNLLKYADPKNVDAAPPREDSALTKDGDHKP